MDLNLILLLLIVCMSSSFSCINNVLCSSMEEEMEHEKQLQILNKSSSSNTIQTEDGYIYDCVDINKQPALDHPLLANHKIQTRPNSYPPQPRQGMAKPKPKASNEYHHHQTVEKIKSATEACPQGTVPIKRTSEDDLVRGSNSRSLLDNTPTNTMADFNHTKKIYLIMKTNKFRNFGAGAYISIHNLTVSPDEQSSSNIWVLNGPIHELNVIVAGWMVSPALYGDSRVRLFTFWTGDGNNRTGCYNTQCPGFVQIHEQVTPTSLIGPASTYGGQQYEMKIHVFQDRKTGNWWLMVLNTNILVGYWPKELFPHMSNGTNRVAWGGSVKAGKDGISPPMGSGHFPDGNFTHACYFADVHYINHKGKMITPSPQDIVEHVDESNCFGLKNEGLKYKQDWGYSFSFGGPGGDCT